MMTATITCLSYHLDAITAFLLLEIFSVLMVYLLLTLITSVLITSILIIESIESSCHRVSFTPLLFKLVVIA